MLMIDPPLLRSIILGTISRSRRSAALSDIRRAVVDENIDRPNLFGGLIHELFQRFLLANVAGDRNDLPLEGSELPGRRFKIFQLAAGDDDLGARRGQSPGNGLADTTPATGYDGDFAL